MKKTTYIALMFSALLLFVGCSNKVYLSGTVTFEDGTPLEQGMVMFESDTARASANIKKNGNYSVGEQKDGDGIMPGHYDVWVVGTFVSTEKDNNADDYESRRNVSNYGSLENLVPGNYNARGKSGLSVDVEKGGTQKFDIHLPLAKKK